MIEFIIDETLDLYIQITKIIDGERELDNESSNTLKERYEKVFNKEIINCDRENLKNIKNICQQKLYENIEDTLKVLKNRFNDMHNKYQTENTYNAIAYEKNSIVREIFQNIFDQKYKDNINIKITFNDDTKKIAFRYNEEGFDLKSIIFYFSAGDNAKNSKQTGKFGLGIKSVMYNVLTLQCQSMCKNNCYKWKITSSEQAETKEEIKKKLTLNYLIKEKNLDGIQEGTELIIGLEDEIYYEIKENLQNIEENLGKYIDIPEIIFAFKKNCVYRDNINTNLRIFIDDNFKEKYWVRFENDRIKFNDYIFNYFEGNVWINEILYLENSNIELKNNKSLYATYKLIEDESLKNRSGKMFISVKNFLVLSTRKMLRNPYKDGIYIINEAEEVLCEFVKNNKNKFKIEISNNLNVKYSQYLEDFNKFIEIGRAHV